MTDVSPSISIVIPVYDEEAILRSAVVDLIDRLVDAPWTDEIVIAENGSTDGTIEVAEALAARFAPIDFLSCDEANYGKALKAGILRARGELVICDEIDLCDTDFHRRAVDILSDPEVDFVVGSKAMPGAIDARPAYRRLGTAVINGMLRAGLGFKGTDTHGLKAFRRASVLPIVRACQIDRDLFASELVIRAERAGLGVVEIPVRVLEKRPPSVGLLRRVPTVLKNLAKLFVAIRIKE